MSLQQEVPFSQVRETIENSAIRNTPLVLSHQVNESWQNYRSRFLGLRGEELWLEYAQPDPGRAVPKLVVGQKLGVAFKQRHHKFVFTTRIINIAEFRLTPELAVTGVQIDWPEKVFRLQRRSFYRASVPIDRPMYVDLWQGGLAQEPDAKLRDKLVYSGQVADISAGGFRIRMVPGRDPALQCGDSIGALVRCAGLVEPLRVDGQFRHADQDEFGLLLGIQFLGLTETPEGRKTMQVINQLVSEFQRIELRRNRSGVSGGHGVL